MDPVCRRQFLLASSALLAAPNASLAQPRGQVRRIGFLFPSTSSPGTLAVFRESLLRAGYQEGKNLLIEARYAEGKVERLAGLAQELVRLKVELIVAVLNSASDEARRATQAIPIVMYANMFPVERGLVASFSHPGGNVTGTVWWAQPQETFTKMFQLLKEAVPNAKHSAVLISPDPQRGFYDQSAIDRNIAAMGMSYTRIEMTRPEDFKKALDQLRASRAEVFYATATVSSRWPEIAAFAIEQKLVSISDSSAYLNAGGLLSYGPDSTNLIDRTVSYVDRILRGSRPRDLAVEQASKYLMALNAKTARAIGFKLPQILQMRVDRVVE